MKKIINVSILIIVIIFAGWFYWKYYYTYSDGNRSGLLQKFSHRGNFFKTYEGELVLNSLITNGTGPISAEKFYFSVVDDSLGKTMSNYEGRRVIIHYQQKNGTLPWRGDTEYIVDSVSLANQ
ncbi:MAG: hypothetical protein ACR2FN_13850 [Chitinophagaceae bacterium]